MKNKNTAFEKAGARPIARNGRAGGRRPASSFDREETPPEFGEDELPRGHVEHEEGQAPDDTLGLYLRQMGSIPLLTRKQELDLAQKLERARKRFRHAVLLNWKVAADVVNMFERILADELAIDPCIDVVTSLNLSRDKILRGCRAMSAPCAHVLEKATAEFRAYLRASTPHGIGSGPPDICACCISKPAVWRKNCRRASKSSKVWRMQSKNWQPKCCRCNASPKRAGVRGPIGKSVPSAPRNCAI